jgi:hypothetical protein
MTDKNFGFGCFRHYDPTFSALECLQLRKPFERGDRSSEDKISCWECVRYCSWMIASRRDFMHSSRTARGRAEKKGTTRLSDLCSKDRYAVLHDVPPQTTAAGKRRAAYVLTMSLYLASGTFAESASN